MNTYRNIELFSLVSDASNPIGEKRTATLSVVASSVGASRVYDQRKVPARTSTLNIVATDPASIADLRAFILRRQGRVVPFWLPSYSTDLVALNDAAAGASVINVQNTNYAAMFSMGSARSHLWIGGQAVQAGSATAASGATGITLQSNLQNALNAGDPISYLLLFRLDTDDVSITYEGTGVASVSLSIVELPNET